jgi:hypothetical protein
VWFEITTPLWFDITSPLWFEITSQLWFDMFWSGSTAFILIPCVWNSTNNKSRKIRLYSGRKLTASFGNVTVRRGKHGKGKGEAQWRRVCLSMYSITENIYYSTAVLRCATSAAWTSFTSYNTSKDCVLCPYVLSFCGLPLPPTCLHVRVNEARIYFASTVTHVLSHTQLSKRVCLSDGLTTVFLCIVMETGHL